MIKIEVETYDQLVQEFILATIATQAIAVQPTNATANKPPSQQNFYGKVETRVPGKNFALPGHGIPLEVGVTVILSSLQKSAKEYTASMERKAATVKTRLDKALAEAARFGIAPNSAGDAE